MNFSLFLLTATTKWSLRLHIVYVVELLQLLLVEASVDPNVAGATPTDDGNAFGVRSLTPSPHQQTATQKRRACCLLVYMYYTSRACNNSPQYEKHTGTINDEFLQIAFLK